MVPPPAKPISVWLAQALCVVAIVSPLYSLVRWAGELPYASIAWQAVRAVLASLLIVGLQRRMQLAGWAMSGLLTLGIAIATFQNVEVLLVGTTVAHRSGQLFVVLVGAVLWLMLPVRLVFGEPARAYFAGKPVRPSPSFEES